MLAYLTSILKINEQINLTSIRDFEQARLLHLEDSLSALPEVEAAIPGKYADIGTGGGFPGVPLCLATGRDTTLVDSRAKKLNAIKEALALSGISHNKFIFEPSRIEDFGSEHRSEFAVITARALSSLSSVMELACPALKVGGTLVAMKANIEEDELNNAFKIHARLGFDEPRLRSFKLSDGLTNRTIVTLKKTAHESIKLPRKIGQAQKNPL